jgi:hypothetical protein
MVNNHRDNVCKLNQHIWNFIIYVSYEILSIKTIGLSLPAHVYLYHFAPINLHIPTVTVQRLCEIVSDCKTVNALPTIALMTMTRTYDGILLITLLEKNYYHLRLLDLSSPPCLSLSLCHHLFLDSNALHTIVLITIVRMYSLILLIYFLSLKY